jgi:hypothetical protein
VPDPMTSPSQEVKPLPCPFCGQEATIEGRELFNIGCRTTDCCGEVENSPLWITRADAIEAWNRRELESRVGNNILDTPSGVCEYGREG